MIEASADLDRLALHSVEVIRRNQATGGAFLASPVFPVYRYSWLRDGAFIADAMSAVGERDSAEAFFRWCADVLERRAASIGDLVTRHRAGGTVGRDEHPPTRFTLDGEESAEPWWNFQLDGYGAWMWALGQHHERYGTALEPYGTALEICAAYLSEFWPEPCYDWWEEHPDHVHTSTLAAIHAGLRAATSSGVLGEVSLATAQQAIGGIEAAIRLRGVRDGGLVKWLDGSAVDGSLLACGVPFGVFGPNGSVMAGTVARIERELVPAGVHRYAVDVYYGGGEWVLLAGFLAWHHAATGRRDAGLQLLTWMADQAAANGDLPEQVSTHLLHPPSRAEWLERWGPVACPLLWSHAMFLRAAVALGVLSAPLEVDLCSDTARSAADTPTS